MGRACPCGRLIVPHCRRADDRLQSLALTGLPLCAVCAAAPALALLELRLAPKGTDIVDFVEPRNPGSSARVAGVMSPGRRRSAQVALPVAGPAPKALNRREQTEDPATQSPRNPVQSATAQWACHCSDGRHFRCRLLHTRTTLKLAEPTSSVRTGGRAARHGAPRAKTLPYITKQPRRGSVTPARPCHGRPRSASTAPGARVSCARAALTDPLLPLAG